MAPSRLQIVSEDTPETAAPPQDHAVAISMMMLALKALSQRALVALASLFTLATVASVFVLAWSMPDPSILQLTKLGMFSVFILAVNWIISRKRA